MGSELKIINAEIRLLKVPYEPGVSRDDGSFDRFKPIPSAFVLLLSFII